MGLTKTRKPRWRIRAFPTSPTCTGRDSRGRVDVRHGEKFKEAGKHNWSWGRGKEKEAELLSHGKAVELKLSLSIRKRRTRD